MTNPFPFSKDLAERPNKVGVILGSGFGSVSESLFEGLPGCQMFSYTDIPDWPNSDHVEGHAGQLVVAPWQNHTTLFCLKGRLHLYQGYTPQQVTFPIRLLNQWGVQKVILTNAAGSLNPMLPPGHLMLITDHLNLTGQNPLSGHPHFVDMSAAYNEDWQQQAMQLAKTLSIRLHTGVYAGLPGPSYETPAEVRMLQALGADAVGMSTVLETIAARSLEMNVLGISGISNMAAGLHTNTLSHAEVLAAGKALTPHLKQLVEALLNGIETHSP